MSKLNLLVLRARQPEKLAGFYSKLGLEFKLEQHGAGPRHYSSEEGGAVFEIYPLENELTSTRNTRIGFVVDSLDQVFASLGEDGRIVSAPAESEWGRRAVVIDPEGHKVELLERKPAA